MQALDFGIKSDRGLEPMRPLSRRSLFGMVAVFAAFVLANAFSITRDPPVWTDEVQDADPAINLLLTGHLTTTAHPFEATAIVPNAWPFFLSLSAWLAVFGISTEAVRWFDATGVMVSVLLLSLGSRRWNLIRSDVWLLVLTAVLLFATPLTLVYRNSRWDVVGVVVGALAFLASSWPSTVYKYSVLFIAGALLPSAGLPLVMYAALVCTIVLSLGQGTLWRELTWIAAGVIVGALLYWILLWYLDAFPTFWRVVVLRRSQVWLTAFGGSYDRDWSVTLTLCGLVHLLWVAFIGGNQRAKRLACAGLFFGLAVPLGMATAGRYTLMYAWMAFVPMIVSLIAGVESLDGSRSARPLTLSLLVAVTVLGLPTSLASSAIEWRQRSYAPVIQFVQRTVNPDDVVYADFAAYYPVKLTAQRAYFGREQLAVLRPHEKQALTLVILNHPRGVATDGVNRTLRILGGEWNPVGQYFSGRSSLRTSLFAADRAAIYHLTAYRRAPD